jgi:hypothetical protein
MSKTIDDSWDAVADVQTPDAAALRSVFGTSSFRVLGNAGVKEQSARDREVCDAIIEWLAGNYMFAVRAHRADLDLSPGDPSPR